MLKFLLLALILVWLFYSPTLHRHGRGSKTDSPSTAKRPSSERDKETMMVACDHCGVHVPENEALTAVIGDRTCHYCCEAHRQAGPSRAGT